MKFESDRRPVGLVFRNYIIRYLENAREPKKVNELEKNRQALRSAILDTLPEQQVVLTASESASGINRDFIRRNNIERFFVQESDKIISDLISFSDSHGMDGRSKNVVMQFGGYYDDMLVFLDHKGIVVRFDHNLNEQMRISSVFKPVSQESQILMNKFYSKTRRLSSDGSMVRIEGDHSSCKSKPRHIVRNGLMIEVKDDHGLYRASTDPLTYKYTHDLMHFYMKNYEPKFLKRAYR